MKNFKLSILSAFAILLLVTGLTHAQTVTKTPSVMITGEVLTSLNLKVADLHQFEQTTVVRKDRDGNNHTYTGVLLSVLLQKAGVTMGKELKGENLSKYASVEASDGYQVVFALAELDSEFTDRKIILADQVDGKPLPVGDGSFRIIVQDEKKPARCIKMVTGIKVAFVK